MIAWSTPADAEEYLGKPRQRQLELVRGTAAPATPHTPTYSIAVPSPVPLLKLCLEATPASAVHVKICDFSESFIFTHPGQCQRTMGIPRLYCPPEALFDSLYPTLAFDIWALAILFHVLYAGGCGLFLCGSDDTILREMVRLIGKLPEPYWSSWENRKNYFDDEGNWRWKGDPRTSDKAISGQ